MLMKLMDEIRIRIVAVPGVYEEPRRVLDLRMKMLAMAVLPNAG